MVDGMSKVSRVFGLHRDTVRILATRRPQDTDARTHPAGPGLSPSPG